MKYIRHRNNQSKNNNNFIIPATSLQQENLFIWLIQINKKRNQKQISLKRAKKKHVMKKVHGPSVITLLDIL